MSYYCALHHRLRHLHFRVVERSAAAAIQVPAGGAGKRRPIGRPVSPVNGNVSGVRRVGAVRRVMRRRSPLSEGAFFGRFPGTLHCQGRGLSQFSCRFVEDRVAENFRCDREWVVAVFGEPDQFFQ